MLTIDQEESKTADDKQKSGTNNATDVSKLSSLQQRLFEGIEATTNSSSATPRKNPTYPLPNSSNNKNKKKTSTKQQQSTKSSGKKKRKRCDDESEEEDSIYDESESDFGEDDL
jgi:hypothetical protein